MGQVQDLINKEGVQKLKTLIEAADICMFVTTLTTLPLTARPMSTAKVDDDGIIWFLSQKSSEKNREIAGDNKVQLFYANKSGIEYLSIFGEATIVINKEKAKELWTPVAKAWFKDGVDDPEVSIIRVVPQDSYYWDTKHNKFVALLKMLKSTITNKTDDDGVEGNITV